MLLVEDQALIAMDTEDTFRRLGARRVRSCPNVARAMKEIGTESPDCAVLDFNLGEQTTVAIAETLKSLEVPFVFATGYGDTSMIPTSLSDVPVITKPINSAALSRELDKILRPLQQQEA